MNRMILATVFVALTLVTGLLFAGIAFQDAEAIKPNPKTKPFKGMFSGSFMAPTGPLTMFTSIAMSSGDYSHLGSSTSVGSFVVDFTSFSAGCIDVLVGSSTTTAADGDTVDFDIGGGSSMQCFFDLGGLPATTLTFCGAPSDIHTSTVSADYVITDGTGRFDDASGSGTVSSAVNHCAGNTFTGTISGDIEYAASNKS